MMMTRLVVFDLDGTLVDSRKDLAFSVNVMLEERGAAALPETQVTRMVGEGARVLVERALAAAGLPADETPRALERFLQIYERHLLDQTRPYEGVPEMLRALGDAGVRMSVLTNKPTSASVGVLQGLGLARCFDEIIGGDSPYPRKPAPAAIAHLMEICGATRDSTVMVGDSRIDLETSRNAGVRCCLVRYGFGFNFGPGDLADVTVVDNPPDIVNAVTARTGLPGPSS